MKCSLKGRLSKDTLYKYSFAKNKTGEETTVYFWSDDMRPYRTVIK